MTRIFTKKEDMRVPSESVLGCFLMIFIYLLICMLFYFLCNERLCDSSVCLCISKVEWEVMEKMLIVGQETNDSILGLLNFDQRPKGYDHKATYYLKVTLYYYCRCDITCVSHNIFFVLSILVLYRPPGSGWWASIHLKIDKKKK